jgi:hypothetical protein
MTSTFRSVKRKNRRVWNTPKTNSTAFAHLSTSPPIQPGCPSSGRPSEIIQVLAGRKVIEKAKGILMKKAGLDDHAAFRHLQKLANDKNRKLIEIAKMILAAEEALEPAASK